MIEATGRAGACLRDETCHIPRFYSTHYYKLIASPPFSIGDCYTRHLYTVATTVFFFHIVIMLQAIQPQNLDKTRYLDVSHFFYIKVAWLLNLLSS